MNGMRVAKEILALSQGSYSHTITVDRLKEGCFAVIIKTAKAEALFLKHKSNRNQYA
jgi:hypothetical protein